MAPKNFFNLVLKVLGLYLIIDILALVPQLIGPIIFLFDGNMLGEVVWTFVTSAMLIFIYGFCAYYLIFRSDWIIGKLKLDKGFDQEVIQMPVHRSTILGIAIIIIGGIIVVNAIPNLGRQLFLYFQERRMTYNQTDPDLTYVLVSCIKIITGLLLMYHQRWIVNFIELRRKK